MRKVIISVAPIGRDKMNICAGEVAADVLECIKNGATMMHLHPLTKNHQFDPGGILFNEIVERIKEQKDIIVQASTGAVDIPIGERYQILDNPYVQSCSFNSGTFNVGDDSYMVNTINDLRRLRDITIEKGIHCDFSLFELGMIEAMRILDEEKPFLKPVVHSLVFGFDWHMPATRAYLTAALSVLPEKALFAVTPDRRKDFSMIAAAISLGAGVVRIGMEDSAALSHGKIAKNNAELVRHTAEIIRMCGCEVATLEEAKNILNIK